MIQMLRVLVLTLTLTVAVTGQASKPLLKLTKSTTTITRC